MIAKVDSSTQNFILSVQVAPASRKPSKSFLPWLTEMPAYALSTCCYGHVLLLPAWVCMSIRLPMFSRCQ